MNTLGLIVCSQFVLFRLPTYGHKLIAKYDPLTYLRKPPPLLKLCEVLTQGDNFTFCLIFPSCSAMFAFSASLSALNGEFSYHRHLQHHHVRTARCGFVQGPWRKSAWRPASVSLSPKESTLESTKLTEHGIVSLIK